MSSWLFPPRLRDRVPFEEAHRSRFLHPHVNTPAIFKAWFLLHPSDSVLTAVFGAFTAISAAFAALLADEAAAQRRQAALQAATAATLSLLLLLVLRLCVLHVLWWAITLTLGWSVAGIER
jgi:hypothetical protein